MWKSCRTMPQVDRFSRDIPFPPSFHSRAAPYSTHFTLSDSQDPGVKGRQISSPSHPSQSAQFSEKLLLADDDGRQPTSILVLTPDHFLCSSFPFSADHYHSPRERSAGPDIYPGCYHPRQERYSHHHMSTTRHQEDPKKFRSMRPESVIDMLPVRCTVER
ncbi:hypothetical protein PR048_023262 [Dryococelus australis]|uniref:Uncharacterized protein n=1 Tax=Dryococelus australis TaxID=614101 RepID=A0ABQ9GTL8_9NEOP|nr:hypothetical protein PR048_023262 [Dryococelus australis]